MKHINRNWDLVLWTCAVVGLGCVGAGQQSTRAQSPLAGWANQDYKVLPYKTVQFQQMGTVLRAGVFASPEEEQKFTEYYTVDLFPRITQKNNRQTAPNDVIGKLHNAFKTCEPKPSQPNKQVFDKLAEITLDFMTKVAKDSQFSPAVRVNAMLAIGEVNSPAAVEALLATTLPDPEQIDAVRVAAMSGLVHLAGQSAMASPAVADPVIARMVKIVGFVPKNGRAQTDVIRWIRGQAADVLAALKCQAGPQNEVPKALLTMLSDKDLPIPLRSKAAHALGRLNYGANPPAPGPYLTALAELARDALSSEQPENRGRAELVARDVKDGLQPFVASTLNPNQTSLLEGLQKALANLNKDLVSGPPPEGVKKAIDDAEESLDGLLKNKG